MGLPWKRNDDINIITNEYTTKLGLNRCFNRLLDNDLYLNSTFDAGIDRATSLRFATRQEVQDLQLTSGAISPANIMALSATESESLTGVSPGIDRFITPNVLIDTFDSNNILPKNTFIDIVYRGEMYSIGQVVDVAKEEIKNFNPTPGTLIIVRLLWGRISDARAEEGLKKLKLVENKLVTSSLFDGFLPEPDDIFFTFKSTDEYEWTFLRYRPSFLLYSKRRDGNKKSRWSIT